MAENPAQILLISDTNGRQNLLADALNRCQTPLDCRRVSSVSHALDLPDEATFDLILLDSNGHDDSCPDIAGRHRRTPLLLLAEPENGHATLETIRRTACDLLIKDSEGFYLQVLPLKIQNLLAMHNARTHAPDGQLAHQQLSEYEELARTNESLRHEIAERIKAEEALKESEIQFKAIFENAGGAILIADAETGHILECNNKAEMLTGRSRDDIIGLHFLQLCPEDRADEYSRIFRLHCTQREGIDFEIELQYADGRRIPAWNSAQVMTIEGKKVIMGLFIDVTEKKRAEEERARLMEVLEEKNAELESIIHVASHDFRTPMITIAGFSGELDRSCRQLEALLDEENNDFKTSSRPVISEDIPEAVELIKASTSKLASLLDGMQRLAKLDHSALQKDTLDMNAMIGDIIKTVGFQAKEAGVSINVEPLPNCFGDKQQINQVFSNLLANAINYLDGARPGIITVTGWLTEGNFVYCVKDNGIGVEKRNLADIFKMYYLIDPEKSQG
jgi:PAS domain S-box-containing protein